MATVVGVMAVGLRGTRVNAERRGIERASERERERRERDALPAFSAQSVQESSMHLCACVFAEAIRACVRDMNVAQGVMSLCLMQERGVPTARPSRRPNHRGCKRQQGRGRALARAIECSMGSACTSVV